LQKQRKKGKTMAALALGLLQVALRRLVLLVEVKITAGLLWCSFWCAKGGQRVMGFFLRPKGGRVS